MRKGRNNIVDTVGTMPGCVSAVCARARAVGGWILQRYRRIVRVNTHEPTPTPNTKAPKNVSEIQKYFHCLWPTSYAVGEMRREVQGDVGWRVDGSIILFTLCHSLATCTLPPRVPLSCPPPSCEPTDFRHRRGKQHRNGKRIRMAWIILRNFVSV